MHALDNNAVNNGKVTNERGGRGNECETEKEKERVCERYGKDVKIVLLKTTPCPH